MRFCGQCGSPVPDDAKACPNCGTMLDGVPAPAPAGKSALGAKLKEKKNLLIGIAAALVVLILAIAIIPGLFSSYKTPVKAAVSSMNAKKLDLEDFIRAEKDEARAEREAEEERARQKEETERRRAEGLTEPNRNTSKKKLQASQKQQNDERRAEAAREERAAKRARLGIEEPEKPSSQVGSRRYARGRAYDPERYGAAPAAPSVSEPTDVSETGEN